jgi:hypothetical protein
MLSRVKLDVQNAAEEGDVLGIGDDPLLAVVDAEDLRYAAESRTH